MKEISIDDLKKIQHPGYGEGLYAQGDDFGEGVDFFSLDSTMINFLSKHYYDGDPDHTQLLFYMVYWKSEEDGSVINKIGWDRIGKILPSENTFSIASREISQHSTSDLDTMRKLYFPNVIDEEEERQKELDAYNKFKEEVKKEQERVKQMEEGLEKIKIKLKIKED
jgi:hypothetical protein